MEIQPLLDNFRDALIALEPYFKKADLEPRGHDWSEGIANEMFFGLVSAQVAEKYGKGVYVSYFSDTNGDEDSFRISCVITKGSPYSRSSRTSKENVYEWDDLVAEEDVLVDDFEDLSNLFVDDPFKQLDYVQGTSSDYETMYIARYEDCKFYLK